MNKLFFFLFLCATHFSNAQFCDPVSLIVQQIRASDTDPVISFEINRHYAYLNPTCTSKNTLLVHLVGSFDNPSSTTLFPALAANNGFHVLVLKYPNNIAAQSACGGSSDSNCYLNFRKEILEGINYSTETDVDAPNSVYNRLLKLLVYLDSTEPSQNWNQFFSGTTTLWNKIIVSGHSQGGGHAAVIAIDKPVKRVLMFASPNDYSVFFNAGANWTTAFHVVADSNYYGFNNINDDVVDFSEQFEIWNNLGMAAFGDSVYVEETTFPYSNTRQLYTKYDTTGLGGDHSVMILDSKTPVVGSGDALFTPVWKYMLGLDQALGGLSLSSTNNRLKIYPNPAKHFITIEFLEHSEEDNFRLYDPYGRLVNIDFNRTKNSLTINTRKLVSGTYYFEIVTKKETLHGKFIIH